MVRNNKCLWKRNSSSGCLLISKMYRAWRDADTQNNIVIYIDGFRVENKIFFTPFPARRGESTPIENENQRKSFELAACDAGSSSWQIAYYISAYRLTYIGQTIRVYLMCMRMVVGFFFFFMLLRRQLVWVRKSGRKTDRPMAATQAQRNTECDDT